MPSKLRLTVDEKRLLNKVEKQRTKDERAGNLQQSDIARYRDRKRRVSVAFKKKLIRRAFRIAGIDTAAIASRHERGGKGDKGILEREMKAARMSARANNRIHDTKLKPRLSKLISLAAASRITPQSTYFELLEQATRINAGHSSIAQKQNVGHLYVKVQYATATASVSNYASDTGYWDFLWTPPRDGFLRILTFVNLNGIHQIYQLDDCNPGEVISGVVSSISVAHTYSDSQTIQDTTRIFDFSDRVDKGIWDSGGDLNSHQYTDSITGVYDRDFFVERQRPVLITVSVGVGLSAQSGGGTIDFTTGGFQVNVPLVYLTLL